MANQPQRAIALDPFFDGDGNTRRSLGPALPGTGAYRDISTERFDDGRPVSERISSGPAGLRGTVIPHATPGGTVRGVHPHNIQDVQIAIDPHIEGQSSVVRLGDISAAAMERATVFAAENTPEPDSIQTQRLRGAAVMHALAANGRNGRTPAQQAAPATIAAPNLSRMGQPVARVIRPLQAFTHGGQEPAERQREPRAIDLSASPRIASQAPTIRVVFEIEQFGTHQASYHDVIVEPGFIVLIYKTSYEGSKYFPEARSAKAPPLALNIVGRSEAYLVHTTGVHYAYEGTEFCVLLVERVVQLPNDEPAEDTGE